MQLKYKSHEYYITYRYGFMIVRFQLGVCAELKICGHAFISVLSVQFNISIHAALIHRVYTFSLLSNEMKRFSNFFYNKLIVQKKIRRRLSVR